MRIQKESLHEIEINKSRFLCYLKRVETEEEAREFIKEIKKEHPKATHHCSAMLISQEIQRSSDDGEPSGTAGIPMLETLRKRNMEKICAVTVRYFGGILLGAGGLIRAYSKSVSEALDHTAIYDVKKLSVYQLSVDYASHNRIERVLSSLMILQKEYNELVEITFASEDPSISDKLEDQLLGKYRPVYLGEKEQEIVI